MSVNHFLLGPEDKDMEWFDCKNGGKVKDLAAYPALFVVEAASSASYSRKEAYKPFK